MRTVERGRSSGGARVRARALRVMFGMGVAMSALATRPAGLAQAQAQAQAVLVEPQLEAEARALFEAGRNAFEDGRFDAALQRFREAYELSHRPQLLYNIGQAADRLRHDAEAVRAFEQYLELVPDAPTRRRVELRLEALRRLMAEASSASASDATSPSPPPTAAISDASVSLQTTPPEASGSSATTHEPERTSPAWAGYAALAGLGVGALGIVPAALALDSHSRLDAACDPSGACDPALRSIAEEGATRAAVADVMFIAGGAAFVGFGLVWWLMSDSGEAPVEATCGSDGCAAFVRGRF